MRKGDKSNLHILVSTLLSKNNIMTKYMKRGIIKMNKKCTSLHYEHTIWLDVYFRQEIGTVMCSYIMKELYNLSDTIPATEWSYCLQMFLNGWIKEEWIIYNNGKNRLVKSPYDINKRCEHISWKTTWILWKKMQCYPQA